MVLLSEMETPVFGCYLYDQAYLWYMKIFGLKKLQEKLRSQRGATLSMAMLLFLICAVVGGVILAAATAAAGRLNQIAETDRRYYNVTSAVQVLSEQIAGEEVTIDQIKTYNEIEGEPAGDAGYGIEINGEEYRGNFSTLDFLSARALQMMFGKSQVTPADPENWEISIDSEKSWTPDSGASFTMSLKDKDTSEQLGETVRCSGFVREDGTLIINVKNGASENDSVYSVALIMLPNIAEETNESDAVPISAEGSPSALQLTKTITKSTVISWYVSSIEPGEITE